MFPAARILEVDLTRLLCTERQLAGEVYRLYPGGSALAAYLILQHTPPGIDALAPDNTLVFAVGPLAGLPIAGQSRLTVAARSPLTGAIGDSQSGGYFPALLKANGWDALVFKGRAPQPVYLHLKGDHYELRAAAALWGRVTGEVEAALQQELGTRAIEVAQIGPGGENLVRFAAVINMCTRANGRTGMGAVMGAKNLKAVVLAKQPIRRRPAHPADLTRLTAGAARQVAENPFMAPLAQHGTAAELIDHAQAGFLPTRNFSTGYFPMEQALAITGTTVTQTILKGRETCYACPVRCKRVVAVPGQVDPKYGGAEYETAAAFGSYCGVGDLTAVARANQLANMYGLDTISCGATIAFAMDCWAHGLITAADTDGVELQFGNAAAMVTMVERIARRQGFGQLLGEGSARAARAIGPNAASLVMAVKGQEFPAHMPQYKASLSLVYATNPFGADHQSSEHDTSLATPPDHWVRRRLDILGPFATSEAGELDAEKARFAFRTQCFYSALDTLGLCQFVWGPTWQLYGPAELLELLRAGIGWETTLAELLRIGERRLNLLRAFNAREGFTRADDRLPERCFQPLTEGPGAGARVDRAQWQTAMDEYYMLAGWEHVTGNPTPEKLHELGLDWIAALGQG